MSKSMIRCQRGISSKTSALLAGLCVGGLVSARPCLAVDTNKPDAAPATRPAEPATRPAEPIDPAVRALIIKLGDDDPAVRDETTRKLSSLGKAAIPGLREAVAGDDPEARSRAKDLLRHIERHLPPPAPPHNGMIHSQSVSMSMNQGARTIDVNDNGRKIHISSKPDGQIEMSVTGVEDGKEATETYHARDAAELKNDNPEAFDIYQQWAGGKGGMVIRGGFGGQIHVQIGPGGPGVVVPGGPLGGGGVVQPLNPQDLQLRVREQQKQIEELQRKLQAETEQRDHDRMRGHTGNDDASSDAGATDESNKAGESGKADGKPADKPRTRPQ